jgi:nephrocystin-4
LFNVLTKRPTISKSFDLVLPVGGGDGSHKKIAFRNPYPSPKVFTVISSRPDLLQIRENRLELGAGASANIGMRFAPVAAPGHSEILVHINDDVDRSEETFSISATYR